MTFFKEWYKLPKKSCVPSASFVEGHSNF